ncbi:nSTAND3 domain-containing NTPase [Burkholderia ambifaria]
MAAYDFHQLSPHDLELLARDLLQAEWGVSIEDFKPGKDRGIDLRCAGAATSTIVQVKHYVRTGLAGLLRDLKKEAAKVRRLKPGRYVLVASVPLSAQNKDEIVAIIGAQYLKVEDVFGQEALNNLLGKHPDVEKQHFKLWLASKAVLDKVLHNAEVTRSQFKAQRVYNDARRYVQNEAFPAASKSLREQGVVIIAGPPGIGKTTLADLLLYQHLELGYQAVVIQHGIEEGLTLAQAGVKQIFYYDDFLGATFAGEQKSSRAGAWDRAFLEFVDLVRARPEARLILTTREHVYSQAVERSERLRHAGLEDLRIHVHLGSYTKVQRAKILYNHLYFSELPAAYQDELLRGEFYQTIVRHDKFSPRLIEWLATYRRVRKVPLDQYQAFVSGLLKDPSEIWIHAYQHEVSDAARSFLLALYSLGVEAHMARVREAFGPLHAERARRYKFPSRPEDFSTALRELDGAFIKPSSSHAITVLDPSVLDLMNRVVSDAPDNVRDILASAVSFDQVERLLNIAAWAAGADALAAAVRDSFASHLPRLVALVIAERRVADQTGLVRYHGSSYEVRLEAFARRHALLPDDALATVLQAIIQKLRVEWESEWADVEETTDAVRALLGLPTSLQPLASTMIPLLCREIICTIEGHERCISRELYLVGELLPLLGEHGGTVRAALQSAANQYLLAWYRDELLECSTVDEFESMFVHVKSFSKQLSLDATHVCEQLEQKRDEAAYSEDRYQDEANDAWREQRYAWQAEDTVIGAMFDSLKDDRA